MASLTNAGAFEVACADAGEYEAALRRPEVEAQWRWERQWVRGFRFRLWRSRRGTCRVCGRVTVFRTARRLVGRGGAFDASHLREGAKCRGCGLRGRQRKTFELLAHLLAAGGNVYLAEQRSALFRELASHFPGRVTGSEYEPGALPGAVVAGVRNEDLERLSFADGSFAAAACCDVLEHTAEPERALRELRRVLAPGGLLLLTVPFHAGSGAVRARRRADGTVEHLLPPAFHVDPGRREGVLVFTDFGFELLGTLAAAGFAAPRVVLYGDREAGHWGVPSQYFTARRA